jgi:hypothetical protein
VVSGDVSGTVRAGLSPRPVQSGLLVSTKPREGSVGAADTDSRSGPCPASVWVSANLGVAASGWLAGESQAVRRLYRLDGLQLRMRVRRRKHIALHRGPAPIPNGPTECWSKDFVHDTMADGRTFRNLTVVDHWSRQSPVLEAGFRMSGEVVGQVLDRALNRIPGPRSNTVDHETEFQSRALGT